MSYEYSENILVQESAGDLLQHELGWRVVIRKLLAKTEHSGAPLTEKFCCIGIFAKHFKN